MVDYKEGASADNGSENRYINKRNERINEAFSEKHMEENHVIP